MQKTQEGFTLVELIVVITIVGILSTVGFVSYSNYLTGARDSNRISQMVKLSDSLQVYAARKSLPLPDDSVEITATGVILGYQGYAGVDVLETIDYTNGGKDPKDDTYFTYNVSRDRKLFQFTSFLEEGSGTSAYLRNTFAVEYGQRTPKSYGQSIGVIMNEDNTPIQEISSIKSAGLLDIYTTTDIYTLYFNDNDMLTGNGEILRGAIGGRGLIGYWSFESLNGNNFLDKSTQKNTGIAAGGISISNDGVIGNSVNFDGINGEYEVNSIKGIGSNGNSPHTISAWINPTAIPGDCGGNLTCREWILGFGNLTSATTGTHLWLIGGNQGNRFGMGHGSQGNVDNLQSGVWTHIVSIYDGDNIIIYLNGEKVPFKVANTYLQKFNMKNSSLFLGKKSPSHASSQPNYNGKIDELRIYNTNLEYSEVQNIYNVEKKELGL